MKVGGFWKCSIHINSYKLIGSDKDVNNVA